MRGAFWESIPKECKTAINELKRMKVFEEMAFDWEDTFYQVWCLARHEVDLYVEGEYGQEDWHNESGCGMNRRQAKTADAWLYKWQELAGEEYKPQL